MPVRKPAFSQLMTRSTHVTTMIAFARGSMRRSWDCAVHLSTFANALSPARRFP
jgi:hypothetical protein